jgi:hypothetical protein
VIVELVASVALGALLLWLAFGSTETAAISSVDDALDPLEDTPRGRALIAIRELDFDRETGKITEADYRALKAQLSREAIRLLDQTAVEPAIGSTPPPAAAVCGRCGPRPEAAARYCSSCGDPIAA